jgi:hypothetical protein
VAFTPEVASRARFTPTHTQSRGVSPPTALNQTLLTTATNSKNSCTLTRPRAADDPDHAVARFLQTTYEAAAELGGWDRSELECDPDRLQA